MADIFISHSGMDNEAAAAIGEHIKRERPTWSLFYDKDNIRAGQRWQERLREELTSCRVVLALLSRNWLGSPWCFTEAVTAAFRGKDVVGIETEDLTSDDLARAPPILHERQRVRLRDGDDRAWQEILETLDRSGLDPDDWFPIPPNVGPYPGLVAFDEKDAGLFFGRKQEITEYLGILDTLRGPDRSQVLVISGGSGSGKSSLLRAGLIPRLCRKPEWVVISPFEVAREPVRNLLDRVGEKLTALGIPMHGLDLSKPPDDSTALVQVLDETLRRLEQATGAWVLLPLDQAEALVAGARPEGDPARLLLDTLAQLLGRRTRHVVVAATIRTEFVPRLETTFAGPEIRLRQAPLSAIGSLAEVIEKPADRFGLELEPGLSERIVEDVHTADALPLLAYTLKALHDRAGAGRRLTLNDYTALGGVQGAIAAKLESVLSDPQPTADEARALQRAFTRYLIRVDEGAVEGERLLRRVVPRISLPQSADRVISRLVDAGLLTTKDATIELAHERMIGNWPKLPLNTWLAQDATDRRLIDQLRQRVNDDTLPDGLLAQAEELMQRDHELGVEESGLAQLVQRSRDLRRARERRRRFVLGGLLLVALVFAVVAWFALVQRNEAIKQTQRAEESLDAAKGAVSNIVENVGKTLRYMMGVPIDEIVSLLEGIQTPIEKLTRLAPDDIGLLRVYLKSQREAAETFQSKGDMQRARKYAIEALATSRELADHYPNDQEGQHQVATMLNKLGSIAFSGGDAVEALKDYQEAADVMRPLTKGEPNSGIWRRELAISLDAIGNVKSQRGDAHSALAAYDEGLAIVRGLAQQDPVDAGLQHEIAIRLTRTGDMKLTTGDTTAAGTDYQEGLKIARTLVEKHRENTLWQHDVFFVLTKIGDLKAQAGDPTTALASYREAVGIVRYLAGVDPANLSLQLDIAQVLCKIGDVDLKGRDRYYDEGLTIVRGLAKHSADNAAWQRALSVNLNKIGDVKLQEDDTDGARAHYSEALTIVENLTERDPKNLLWLRDVALSLSKVGDVRLRTGDATGAIANYEQALAKIRALLEHDPDNTLWLEDLSVTLNMLGDAKLRTGDTNAAAMAFDESLTVARRLADGDPGNAQWQSDLWLAFNNVGDVKLRTSDANSAIPNYQEALGILRRLSERDLNSTLWLQNMKVRLSKLGDASLRAADAAAAAASYEEFQAIAQLLAKRDPGNELWQSGLWYALYNLGGAKLRLGDSGAARNLYSEALTIIRSLTAEYPANVKQQTNLVLNLCGIASLEDGPDGEQLLNEALAILERLRAAGELPPDRSGWPDLIRRLLEQRRGRDAAGLRGSQ